LPDNGPIKRTDNSLKLKMRGISRPDYKTPQGREKEMQSNSERGGDSYKEENFLGSRSNPEHKECEHKKKDHGFQEKEVH